MGTLVRRLLLVVACLVAVAPARAAAPLDARLAAVLGKARTPTGALVVDLETGEVVYTQNAGRAFVPASNEKLPVAYSALARLGPDFRVRTEVVGDGVLAPDGVWHGRLVLRGYGDPTLTHWGLRSLATQVRKAGIRRISGPIVGDESYFDTERGAPGWKSSFVIEESPPLSALVVDRAEIDGTISTNPALAAATLFRRALVRAGVEAPGPVSVRKGTGLPLAAVYSKPLREIVHTMGTDSDNFTAEMVLKLLGAVAGGGGTTAAGAEVVRATLAGAGVPLAGVRIVDGSGLSSLDRLTARALVGILLSAWHDPALRTTFVGALAIAGRTGTLERRLNAAPARGHVRAKTGTTNLALALSGFVRTRYAFSVLENGSPVPYWAARKAQESFVQLLAAQ